MDSTRFCCAVDLGATNVRCAIMGENGEIFGYQREEIANISKGSEISAKIVNMIESAVEKTGLSFECVGISTAGPVDLKSGSVVNSPNMKADEIFLTSPISSALGVPAFMLTDCKAGAYGEYVFGRHSGADTLVYLTMSTGIGAGVLSKGEILLGADGNACEVGHFTVDTVYNMQCGCGCVGHWEAYSSGSGMPKFFAEWLKRSGADLGNAPLSSGQILFAARNGDAICSEFVSEVSKMNSRGLSSVVCAYNPDVIVLDGPLVREYADLLIGDFGGYLRCPHVCVTELEGNAPLMGAGAYALRNLKDGKG